MSEKLSPSMPQLHAARHNAVKLKNKYLKKKIVITTVLSSQNCPKDYRLKEINRSGTAGRE